MADALHSFRRLTDPSSGRPLSEKAVFIAMGYETKKIESREGEKVEQLDTSSKNSRI
ncbi:MAG: hypothetical protein QXF46_08915 [Thermofilaceae archaeon]